MFHEKQQIGPFTLVRYIGKGSYAEVWLATEKRPPQEDREVAVKLLDDKDIDLDMLRGFVIEAEAWIKVSEHPNVLTFITAKRISGQLLFVSEYAPEGNLGEWLVKRSVPSIDCAIAMITGILKGVGHIHSHEIVHRDLKPANVLLRDGKALIADFGMARMLSRHDSTQRIAGSYAYMAPEVLNGERCFQQDIWAAGIILYEMVSGNKPFKGPDENALKRAIQRDPYPPLADSVPKSLRLIVDKALKKEKSDRYQSAQEMLKALRTAEEELLNARGTRNGNSDDLIQTIAKATGACDAPTESDDIKRAIVKPSDAPTKSVAIKRTAVKFFVWATLIGAVVLVTLGILYSILYRPNPNIGIPIAARKDQKELVKENRDSGKDKKDFGDGKKDLGNDKKESENDKSLLLENYTASCELLLPDNAVVSIRPNQLVDVVADIMIDGKKRRFTSTQGSFWLLFPSKKNVSSRLFMVQKKGDAEAGQYGFSVDAIGLTIDGQPTPVMFEFIFQSRVVKNIDVKNI